MKIKLLVLGLITLLNSCIERKDQLVDFNSEGITPDQLIDTILNKKRISILKYQAIECINILNPSYLKNYERKVYPAYLKWIVKNNPEMINEKQALNFLLAETRNTIRDKRKKYKDFSYSAGDSIKVFSLNRILFSKLCVITTSNKFKNT
ncbi:MAG: hypothetical protein WKF85_01390 [Chitinophagaceae bacterium]